MQNVVVESVEQARRRDTVKISWQIFSKAFEGTPEKDGTKSFNVGRSFMETIYFSIFTACRMSGYPVLIQDLIKHETLLFKESFMKRFYKNFQVFRSKTLEPLGFKMENLNVRAYIDILIRKLSPSIEQQKAIDVAYAMLGSEKILAQNFNVDYAYGNALSIKKIEPNVAAANVYYIATKHSQQEIAKALYITTVPIQRHYKQLVSLMGKITASKAAT
jgi:transcription initiation factor TFIIIB Brf1 subunit/transcription initiation factor TFIIB